MHSTRALHRGLQVLEALNDHNGALVSDIARATGLPRTSAFRVLENLCRAGYARRDRRHGGYFVASRAQRLSHAFRTDSWIADIAQPVLEGLAGLVHWPIYLLTLSGTTMQIRATTTYESPLAIDALPPGTPVPLATSGAGKAYLAFCDVNERTALLAQLRESGVRDVSVLKRGLADIRRRGYALDIKARMRRNPGRTTSIAVPIIAGGRVRAALTLRYSDTTLPLHRAVKRFVPLLRQAARRIAVRLPRARGR